jgi:outer membrane protein TolC
MVTYQSDAANMSDVWETMGLDAMLAAMGQDIPDLYMRKLQGKVQVDVQQTLWDGGKSEAERQTAEADRLQQEAQVDVDFYQLDNRVMALYFGILLLDEQQNQLTHTDSLLRSNLKRVQSLYDNEMALRSDVDAVEVELLSLEQKQQQLHYSRQAYREMLSLMAGRNITEETLAMPAEIAMMPQEESTRPELHLLSAKSDYFASQRKSIQSLTMPQFSAFAQGWYGYPTLNMFESMQSGQWGLNGIVGLRMQWNLWGFYTQKNRMNQLDLAQQQLEVQRDVFLYNQRLQRKQESTEITRLTEALDNDERIVSLRGRVRKAAETKYENGTITTSELLQKIADESAARSARSLHQIELLKAKYELNNL